jgi:hypothetical protein
MCIQNIMYRSICVFRIQFISQYVYSEYTVSVNMCIQNTLYQSICVFRIQCISQYVYSEYNVSVNVYSEYNASVNMCIQNTMYQSILLKYIQLIKILYFLTKFYLPLLRNIFVNFCHLDASTIVS